MAHGDPIQAAPLVLVVDDDDDQRGLLAEFLERDGFRVETAVDGADALERVAHLRPAAIVMDLCMPRLDGCEATRRIKGDESKRSIPVIVLSAHAIGEYPKRARAAGADEIVAKPCRPAALARRIRELVGVAA